MTGLGSMWPPELAARKLVLLLRPPNWPLLAPAVRPRVRFLACTALVAQAVFIAAWIVAGALEPGYQPADQTVSQLGGREGEHPWIVNAGFLAWGAGFVALGWALMYSLRPKPWWRVSPLLFALCGVCAAAFAFLPLDCSVLADPGCEARRDAGLLSWRHYGHDWVGLAFQLLLMLTPFTIARSQWPSRLGRLTLLNGVIGVVLGVATFLSFHAEGAPYGIYQRLGLGVVHVWVLLIAGALLIEASSRWPKRSVAEGPFASLFDRTRAPHWAKRRGHGSGTAE